MSLGSEPGILDTERTGFFRLVVSQNVIETFIIRKDERIPRGHKRHYELPVADRV